MLAVLHPEISYPLAGVLSPFLDPTPFVFRFTTTSPPNKANISFPAPLSFSFKNKPKLSKQDIGAVLEGSCNEIGVSHVIGYVTFDLVDVDGRRCGAAGVSPLVPAIYRGADPCVLTIPGGRHRGRQRKLGLSALPAVMIADNADRAPANYIR